MVASGTQDNIQRSQSTVGKTAREPYSCYGAKSRPDRSLDSRDRCLFPKCFNYLSTGDSSDNHGGAYGATAVQNVSSQRGVLAKWTNSDIGAAGLDSARYLVEKLWTITRAIALRSRSCSYQAYCHLRR